jgi:probable HAF family extracellular repeat protein
MAQNFATVSYPGSTLTGLYGINSHGVAVGYYASSGGYPLNAVMLSQGVFTTINVPTSPSSVAFGINDNGEVVGYDFDPVLGQFQGFLLSGGSYTTIRFPGSVSTQPRGINNAGQIVGIYQTSDGKSHGFDFVNGVYTTVDCPCGQTALENISNSGTMVGYYIDASNAIHGLEYSSGDFATLDFPGGIFTYLNDINDSGTIVGTTSTMAGGGAQVGFQYANGQFSAINAPPPYQGVDYAAIPQSMIPGK